MTKIHLQCLKSPMALLCLLKLLFLFPVLVVKNNLGSKYTRDTLWLNWPLGKKMLWCFPLQFEVQVLQVLELFLHLFRVSLNCFCSFCALKLSGPQRVKVPEQSYRWKRFKCPPWSQIEKLKSDDGITFDSHSEQLFHVSIFWFWLFWGK